MIAPPSCRQSCHVAARIIRSLQLAIYNLVEADRVRSLDWKKNCLYWAAKRRREADEIAAMRDRCRTCPYQNLFESECHERVPECAHLDGRVW